MRKSLSSLPKQNSLKETLAKNGLTKQDTTTTSFAGLKIITANDRDFVHVIEAEENEEDSKEESGIKTNDDKDCNPFEEIDDFVGISKQQDIPGKPKMFDMGDDIHNLCDTPEVLVEKEEEKDALADLPVRS